MEEIQSLIAELLSGDDERAQAAVKKIAGCGPDAIPPLKVLMESPDADTRWWATWALSQVDDPEVPCMLRPMLRDPEMSVRECAALALRENACEKAVPELVDAMNSPDAFLSHIAAIALAALGERATPSLIKVVEEGPHHAQLNALRALATIGDPQSIPALMKVLENDSVLMEYWANEGLDKIGVGMQFFQT
ncbi:MAG: hypothetical protein EHM41_19260 [Chloroflexi bacterium]|nr:MAG: hypothetical protein EHM41_19260 [Chloroflexota bacterium]